MGFNKGKFLQAAPKRRKVELDGFGSLYMQELSLAAFQAAQDKAGGQESEAMIYAIMDSAVDETGRRVFKGEDKALLKRLPAARLMPLIEACNAINDFGMTEDAAVGKSATTTTSDSGTA